MKNSYRSICIYGLIFLSLSSGAGCNLSSSKVEGTTANSNTIRVESTNSNADSAPNEKTSGTGEQQITAASVAGTYKYYTVKNNEGYDNSLDVEDKGGGKLHVTLSGSYLYLIDGAESMHGADGEGDAQLKGNVAVADMKDETEKNCRVTITFTPKQATVKTPENCHFNVVLDGVYKKGSPKPVEKQTSNSPKMREVSYDKLADFVNDFQSRKVGDRYVIKNVPAGKIAKNSRADESGTVSYKGLFYLQTDDDDNNVATAFLTSAAMIKSLATNAEYEPANLRVTAVLVESSGEFDVYRMSFVTKVEGLNDNGSVMWTATGTEPAKVKFKN